MSLFSSSVSKRDKVLVVFWWIFFVSFPVLMYSLTDFKLWVQGRCVDDTIPVSLFVFYFGSIVVHTMISLLLNRKRAVFVFLTTIFFPFLWYLAIALSSSAKRYYAIEENVNVFLVGYIIYAILVFKFTKLDAYLSRDT